MTQSLPAALIPLIDERIKSKQFMTEAKGTVANRVDSTHVNVIFDGSNVAMLVPIFGDLVCEESDRVALLNVKGEWVVAGVYTPHPVAPAPTPAFDYSRKTGPSGTVTSSSYIDLADTSIRNLVKASASYRTMVRLEGTLYVAVADSTAITIGVRVDGGTDYEVIPISATNGLFVKHTPWAFTIEITGLSVGSHSFQPRWKRTTGAGTGTVDGGDVFSMTLWEVPV